MMNRLPITVTAIANKLLRLDIVRPISGSFEILSWLLNSDASVSAILRIKTSTAAAVGAIASPTSTDRRSMTMTPVSTSFGIQINKAIALSTVNSMPSKRFH